MSTPSSARDAHGAQPATASTQRALTAVAVQFTINGLVYGTYIPRLPEIQRRIDVSVGALGWMLAAGTAASLLASTRTGAVMSRWATRSVLAVAASCSTAALVVIGLATNPIVFVLGLMAFAAADVFADVSMNMFGSDISAQRATPVMNRLHGMWSLGGAVAGLATVLVVRSGVSVPVHLGIVAAVLIAGIVYVNRGLPLEAGRHDGGAGDSTADESAADESTADGARAGAAPGRLSSARSGAMAALGIGAFAAIAIELVGMDWATFRLSRDLGVSDGLAVTGFVGFGVGMVAGRLGGDWVQVRLGRLAMTRVSGVLALAGSVAVTGIAIPWLAVLGFILLGLGTSVLFPQLYDAAAFAPGRRGSGFTALLVGQRFGGTLVPIVVAGLANTDALDFGQAMALVFIPMSLLVLVGANSVVRFAPGAPTR